eukprot:CAMPEP_0201897780 /NCGR_PEP_ID=MMETSP0902-20130614/47231_1 /ASSEMBLY_ACC=CAM_ASM_000551 /TAXON_ID=420261 /ORGANISM="Thalassiosira antarctica, Strain CCMP982" /LENGTH=407 /DNA_ID=CAMNT_0048430731 /DNA_START=41 /DNA_END=1264 /DNA_ORIENTATION=+
MRPKALLMALSVPIAGTASFVPPCRTLPSPTLLTRKAMGGPNMMHRADDADSNDFDDDTSETIDCDEAILSQQYNNRRSILSSFAAASALLGLPVSPAWAVKGAAEYDLEYYMRDLFMGNKREGNLPASNAPPPHPPRNLLGQLPPLLLDDELQSCIPIQELAKITNIPITTLSEQVASFRSKVQTAFRATHPWNEELVRDEYYFDLTCYALWRTASVAIPQFNQRDLFLRNIGRRLLSEIMSREMISKKSIETLNNNNNHKALTLTDTVPCIIEILTLFQSANYCTNYRLGDKNEIERTGLTVFDQLDDEEISSPTGGGSVNCLVSVFDPAALGGALQITGEGSRFAPDFVGPTLAAVWERVGGGEGVGTAVSVSFESYFVDPVYRPNPKDFFPNERFYQFTIARK